MKDKIEITVNDSAIVVIVREGCERGQLLHLLPEKSHETIIIDLSYVERITSAFITDLVTIHKTFNMLICGINKKTISIFNALGLNKIFKFVCKYD